MLNISTHSVDLVVSSHKCQVVWRSKHLHRTNLGSLHHHFVSCKTLEFILMTLARLQKANPLCDLWLHRELDCHNLAGTADNRRSTSSREAWTINHDLATVIDLDLNELRWGMLWNFESPVLLEGAKIFLKIEDKPFTCCLVRRCQMRDLRVSDAHKSSKLNLVYLRRELCAVSKHGDCCEVVLHLLWDTEIEGNFFAEFGGDFHFEVI